MLKDCKWSEDRSYESNSSNEPIEFYLNGLLNSKSYDLLLGYQSSSAINLLSHGFAAFISNGGNMRLVINHILSEKDKKALERGDKGIQGDRGLRGRKGDLGQKGPMGDSFCVVNPKLCKCNENENENEK